MLQSNRLARQNLLTFDTADQQPFLSFHSGAVNLLMVMMNTHFCLETGMPVPSVPALAGRLGWLSGWAAG